MFRLSTTSNLQLHFSFFCLLKSAREQRHSNELRVFFRQSFVKMRASGTKSRIRDINVNNITSFPSSFKPLFESEAKWRAIDMKVIFYSHANKTHFHKKSFALLRPHFESGSFWNSEMACFFFVLCCKLTKNSKQKIQEELKEKCLRRGQLPQLNQCKRKEKLYILPKIDERNREKRKTFISLIKM